MKLNQWIVGAIIAERIKSKDKKSLIVGGGISSKDTAIAYLKNFISFDVGIWGEGEYPLLSLAETLSNNQRESFSNV